MLDDEKAGILFKSLLKYGLDSEDPEFNDFSLQLVWAGIKVQLDDNAEKYELRCQRNRENVRKRWNKQDTIVNDGKEEIQSDTIVNDGKNRIPNDMICNDMICNDMSYTTQLSSDKSSDNVSVCDNKTHTRTHEAFLKFKEMYKESCPRLASSDLSQPNERGFVAMYQLCGGDTNKMWSILIEMNNKRDTLEKYTSITQTFRVFFDKKRG